MRGPLRCADAGQRAGWERAWRSLRGTNTCVCVSNCLARRCSHNRMHAGNSEGAVSSQRRASETYAHQPAWHALGPKLSRAPVPPRMRYGVTAPGRSAPMRARPGSGVSLRGQCAVHQPRKPRRAARRRQSRATTPAAEVQEQRKLQRAPRCGSGTAPRAPPCVHQPRKPRHIRLCQHFVTLMMTTTDEPAVSTTCDELKPER